MYFKSGCLTVQVCCCCCFLPLATWAWANKTHRITCSAFMKWCLEDYSLWENWTVSYWEKEMPRKIRFPVLSSELGWGEFPWECAFTRVSWCSSGVRVSTTSRMQTVPGHKPRPMANAHLILPGGVTSIEVFTSFLQITPSYTGTQSQNKPPSSKSNKKPNWKAPKYYYQMPTLKNA